MIATRYIFQTTVPSLDDVVAVVKRRNAGLQQAVLPLGPVLEGVLAVLGPDKAPDGDPHGDAPGGSGPAPGSAQPTPAAVSGDPLATGRSLVKRRRRPEVLLDAAEERRAAVVRDVPVRPRAVRLHAGPVLGLRHG